MNYIIWIQFRSIKVINSLLFLLALYVNAFFYMYSHISNYSIMYFVLNLILLVLFYIVNKAFENEFKKSKKDLEILSRSWLNWKDQAIKNILLKKNLYTENIITYKLFRDMYIRKNLAHKDYDDLKNVFIKFIPETFLKEVGKTWIDKISFWVSIKKNLSVMFLDIIWFTTVTEKLDPDKALLLLNIYFDGIVEIIKNNWWYIDKFLGDGIMAIFSWEETNSSIKASLEIQDFIKKITAEGTWKKISIWIWINSWEVILWTIWSNKRMEITIIWDVVNTASRIEWLTRILKSNIIISDATFKNLVNPEDFLIKDLWYKVLRGKKERIKIYWVWEKI